MITNIISVKIRLKPIIPKAGIPHRKPRLLKLWDEIMKPKKVKINCNKKLIKQIAPKLIVMLSEIAFFP